MTKFIQEMHHLLRRAHLLLYTLAALAIGVTSASLVAENKSLLILPASNSTRIQSVETISLRVGDKGSFALVAAGTVSDGQFLVLPHKSKGEADQFGPKEQSETAGFIVRASSALSSNLETEWIKILSPENPKTDSTHVSGVVSVPKEGAVIITGTFTGRSLTFQAKTETEALVRVLGGGASVTTAFVAKISAKGVFEWATGVQTMVLSQGAVVAESNADVADEAAAGTLTATTAVATKKAADAAVTPIVSEEKNISFTPISPNGKESAGTENVEDNPNKNDKVEEKRQLHRRSDIDTSKTGVEEYVNAQFPVLACLDKEGNILVVGTYNGLMQMPVGNTTSKSDVFDAFIMKVSSKTGDILANHANFVAVDSLNASGMQSVFVVNSIELDPCPESPGSIIVTGQSYLASVYSKEGINHAFATMHAIRLVSLPSKDEKLPANMFEVRETRSVALGRLQVNPESAATPIANMNQRRITRGMHFVAVADPEGDSCAYFVSGVMVKKEAMQSSEKGLISAAKVDEAYTGFVAQMSNNFTFKEDGVRFELPVFVDGDKLKAPSIAVGLNSILYVSGSVKNPQIPYEALSGISLSETAPHNYILGIDSKGRRISSKTAIPQPADLELLKEMQMTLGDTVQLQSSSSSSDELVAHGMLGSQEVIDQGMWLGVLDLSGVTAYSDFMAPKIEQTGAEKTGTQAKEGDDSAVVTSSGSVAPSPVPIPAEPKSNAEGPVTSSLEQKEVVEDSKAVLTADSTKPSESQPPEKPPTDKNVKPPVVIEKPAQTTEKPVVPPVDNSDEAEEDNKAPAQAHAEDAAGHSNEDRIRHVESTDSFFTGVGFLFMFIFMAITAAVLVIVYKLRRENLGDVIDMKDLPGSLYNLFNTLFDSKAQGANRGTYAPAASKQDDESELQELAHPAVPSGRSILSAAPLTHRKSSVAESYNNALETSIPINYSGNAPGGGDAREVSPTFPGNTAKFTLRQSEDVEPMKDESWGWDDGDVFEDGSESKNVKKEDDEWGW